MGTVSMPQYGDRNNSLDTSFTTRHNIYQVEFQKYFLVKNIKVLLEKQVRETSVPNKIPKPPRAPPTPEPKHRPDALPQRPRILEPKTFQPFKPLEQQP
jgi:hypothetical protein